MMTRMMNEDELMNVAGGCDQEDGWDFSVTCSCGYEEHFESLKDATKAMIEHMKNGLTHNCHLNVNYNSNK